MRWFPASLSVAFLNATEAALAKKVAGDLKPLEMAAFPVAYSLPLFLLALPFLPEQDVPAAFWWTIATLVPFNAAGFLLHMSAVNISPLSLTMPFLAFTPAFTAVIGFLMLGERINPLGFLGIAAIVAGSYAINLDSWDGKDLLAPFKAILREPGSRLMLLTSFIYGICSVLGKKMVLLAGPFYSGVVFFLILNAAILAGLLLFRRVSLRTLFSRPKRGMALGATTFLHYMTHLYAVALVQTAYMISIKRLSGLFSVVYGRLLFKESHAAVRFTGAGLMFLGALCIGLAA